MAAFVVRYSAPGGAWQFQTINHDEFNFGRIEGNDLVLSSGLVSRQHARVKIQGSQIWLIDLNSSNGTLLNGQRIPPNQWVLLTPGQYFRIGEIYLCLEPLQASVPAYPPPVPLAAPIPQAPFPPQPAAYARPVPDPIRSKPAPKRPSAKPWLIAGIILILAIVVFFAAYFLSQRLPPSNPAHMATQIAQATPEIPKPLATLSVQPGGAAVKDANGVSANLAPGALPEGKNASLLSAQLTGDLARKIGEAYSLDTPAYSVSAGSSDAISGAALTFPAKSDAARVAVLIDNQYFGILDNPPQNGQLAVEAPVASTDFANPNYTTRLQSTAAQFFIVSPKKQTRLPDLLPVTGIQLASYHFDEPDGKSCVAEFWTVTHCWRNNEKSIYVFWQDDYPTEIKDQDYLKVIETIKTIKMVMDAYASKGITTAVLSSSKPLYVVIDRNLREPNYSPQTGTIYLDWGFVSKSGGAVPDCTIAHEVMHLIEHKKYYMLADYYSNEKAWWLDMAAEMGSFWLNPACVDRSLTMYGKVETNSQGLGFQSSAFTWDGGEQARYIQAQQVWISTCSGGANCALSLQGFAKAISEGTFPFNDSTAKDAYYRNAKDLGLYLLGAAPQASRGDVAIPPSAVAGKQYGDYLVLKGGDKAGIEYGLTNGNFQRKSPSEVSASAAIQKGGVYPLWVGSGKGTPLVAADLPGLPGMLKIEAGTPLWISLDGSAPKFYDGTKPLTIAPLSAKLGKGLARIVAVAPDGNKTFKANLSVADFSGDWSATISAQRVTPIDCKGYDSSGSAKSADDTFLQIFSGMGTYKTDPTAADGSHLVWEGSLPQGITGSSEIFIKPDGLQLNYLIDQPMPGTSFNGPFNLPPVAARQEPWQASSLILGLPALPVMAVLAHKRRSRWQRYLLLAVLLVSLAVLCSGCFGIGIYGKIQASYTFKKAEYIDPQNAPGSKSDVLWNLSDGDVKFDVDYTFVTVSTESNASDKERCQLSVTARATGIIGAADSVPAPNLGSAK